MRIHGSSDHQYIHSVPLNCVAPNISIGLDEFTRGGVCNARHDRTFSGDGAGQTSGRRVLARSPTQAEDRRGRVHQGFDPHAFGRDDVEEDAVGRDSLAVDDRTQDGAGADHDGRGLGRNSAVEGGSFYRRRFRRRRRLGLHPIWNDEGFGGLERPQIDHLHRFGARNTPKEILNGERFSPGGASQIQASSGRHDRCEQDQTSGERLYNQRPMPVLEMRFDGIRCSDELTHGLLEYTDRERATMESD